MLKPYGVYITSLEENTLSLLIACGMGFMLGEGFGVIGHQESQRGGEMATFATHLGGRPPGI